MKRTLATIALASILTAAGGFAGGLVITAPLIGVPALAFVLACSWHCGNTIARSAVDE